MWHGPLSPSTATANTNYPPPPAPPLPDPRESQAVDRHLGMWCGCRLLDCCHNEDQDPCPDQGRHAHSGNPATGYMHPWEPGDESWRDMSDAEVLLGVARDVWYA